MKKLMLPALLLGLTLVLSAQTGTTKKSTPAKTPAKAGRHHRARKMLHQTLGWKCRKHGTVCELDMEDILAAQGDPAHSGCDPTEAIWVNVDQGQSLSIVKHDLKKADFTLDIEPQNGASPYPFADMPPKHPVPHWWTGPATADPGTCYHLHVTLPTGESGDPHIMFCVGGQLC